MLKRLVIFSCLMFCTTHTWADNRQMRVYSINPIPFKQHEVTLEKDNIILSFAEYNSVVTLTYPAPQEKIPSNTSVIIDKCKDTLRRCVNDIISAQHRVLTVKNYLTADGEIELFTASKYINLINKPQEFTVQAFGGSNKTAAEFRSREITSDKGNVFCLYMTFIYNDREARIEKIIISVVNLYQEA